MAPSSGDVLRCTCKLSWGEDEIQNVYHVQITGTVPADNATLLSDIISQFDVAYDFIDTAIPDEITFDTVEIYNLTQDEYVGEDAWTTLIAGAGSASDPMPPQIAPLVLFNTGTLRSQGRKFLPTVTENKNDTDGTPDTSMLTVLASYAADLIAGWTFATYDAALGNYREATATFIEWLSAEVRDIWATQRRRYFGSGI